MDTMVVLTIYRGINEIMDRVNAVLKDKILLIIPDVIKESARVYEKVDLRGKRTVPNNFESSALFHFTFHETAFVTAEPEPHTYDSAVATCAKREYVNEEGEPLSRVDSLLLCLAKENPNVDVMTEDGTLLRAISSECGSGGGSRGHRVMEDYYERRNATARFIRRLLKARRSVDWKELRAGTEYLVDKSWIVEISESGPLPTTSIHPRSAVHQEFPGDRRGAATAISAFFQVWGLDGWCLCGDPEGRIFACTCGQPSYWSGRNGGLQKADERRFLSAIPGPKRNLLLKLARSFDGSRDVTRGRPKTACYPAPLRSRKRHGRWARAT